jgi:hypothetical protein
MTTDYDDDDGSNSGDNYNRHRKRQGNKSREQSTEARDIGVIPKVVNPKRRAACARDLRKYLLTYYPESFPLPFSEDHERILLEIQTKALDGGLKAIAMPRGSGKTTILIRAINWVLSYGHRRFAVLVEADEGAAEESLDTIKIEWEANKLLLDDFPEIAYPIKRLEGITQRGNAQTCQGERTMIGWRRKELIFPTIAKSVSSGATIRCSGIMGRIRGMNKTTSDGKTNRPDFVLINDPQTDSSATSEVECAKREKVMAGAILGLAGPGKRIAGFAAVTVIREGDAADRLLNRQLMPKWHGDRCQLVYAWPTDEELWRKYLDMRSEEIAAGNDEHPKANAYYKANQAAMDAGAAVGWPSRKFNHELTAIQHAINLRADNPDTFDAEYQNTPRSSMLDSGAMRILSSDEFCLRVLPTHRRAEVPQWAEWITLGVDVQQSSLWWSVAAIGQDFSGTIIDYGVWPDQGVDYITLSEVDRTIAKATKITHPSEAAIEALRRFMHERFANRYIRDDGSELKITQAIVDAGYLSEAVYRYTQETTYPILPSHGKGVTARNRPWSHERRKKGERLGFGWRMPPSKGTRIPRFVLIDTNTWKTTIHTSFTLPVGEPGAWTLYRAAPLRHRMWADNLSAEYAVQTSGQGRTLLEWACKPNRDNHGLDSVVLAAVAGNMAGAKIPGETAAKFRKVRKVSVPKSGGTNQASTTEISDRDKYGTQAPKIKKTLAQMRAEKRK